MAAEHFASISFQQKPAISLLTEMELLVIITIFGRESFIALLRRFLFFVNADNQELQLFKFSSFSLM